MAVIDEIESELLGQLTSAFTKPGDARPWLKVEGWPVRPEGYKLTGAGDVLVIFSDAPFASTNTQNSLYPGDYEFEILLRARNLRDKDGAYAMIECALVAVSGRRLQKAAGLTRPTRCNFVDYSEGVFAYALKVVVPVTRLLDASGPIGPWRENDCGDGPALSQINHELKD